MHTDIGRLQQTTWDAIVIGTGMGGGTLGYALARAGMRVLFLERGLSHLDATRHPLLGEFPERYFSRVGNPGPEAEGLLRRAGRCTRGVVDRTDPVHPRTFVPLLGEGTGGSSSLYGAALERFFPEDFAASKHHPLAAGSSLVDWPIGYADLEPYYERAEGLYGVHGSPDPLRPVHQSRSLRQAEFSPSGRRLVAHWQGRGLHPYRLPVGHLPHDRARCPGCQATLCGSGEKLGAAEACVAPAVRDFGATVLDDCEVLELRADATKVTRIQCRRGGVPLSFHGARIFLAAGALHSPALLLRSKSRLWPNGLANASGQVGRNLCRHFLDLHIVALSPTADGGYWEKEVALNDFYFSDGLKLGTLQSLGNPPHVKSALHEMYAEARGGSLSRRLLCHFYATLGRPLLKAVLTRGIGLAAIMEDLPYADNRVESVPGSGALAIQYRMRPEAVARLRQFRLLIRDSLKPFRSWLHPQGENNQRLAHACGTCRMGSDRRESVVDASNRVHDLENLFLVDASFFPTSGGLNPALTIAANALRVADILLRRTPRSGKEREQPLGALESRTAIRL